MLEYSGDEQEPLVRGFVDLHSHWIAGIDDGARTPEAGVSLLRGLKRAGFDTVVATPHMRPGMFDNDKAALERAFASMCPHIVDDPELPDVHLASEHFLDEIVFQRLVRGAGLPYPDLAEGRRSPRRGVLIELAPQGFPTHLQRRLFDLARSGLRPVLAHPERYQEAYEAACSDAHRPEDAETTAEAIEALEQTVGLAEATRLLRDGPRQILGMA